MLEEIKRNTIGTQKYSEEYWDRIQEIVYREDKDFGKFLILYFQGINKENVLSEDCRILVLILKSLYPVKDHQIEELSKAVTNLMNKLSLMVQEEDILRRDYLYYYLMDLIFHNSELVDAVSKETNASLLNAILQMSELEYDATVPDSESYYKNYIAIQFMDYFEDEKKKVELINKYLNHFDSRLIDEINSEIKEEGRFGYFKR